jgi:hypothetical protein
LAGPFDFAQGRLAKAPVPAGSSHMVRPTWFVFTLSIFTFLFSAL